MFEGERRARGQMEEKIVTFFHEAAIERRRMRWSETIAEWRQRRRRRQQQQQQQPRATQRDKVQSVNDGTLWRREPARDQK